MDDTTKVDASIIDLADDVGMSQNVEYRIRNLEAAVITLLWERMMIGTKQKYDKAEAMSNVSESARVISHTMEHWPEVFDVAESKASGT